MTDYLKKRAKKAQEELLEVVKEVFKSKNGWIEKAPSYVTDKLDLSKKLGQGKHEMKEGHNHRLAQGLINELLNRGELEHQAGKGYRYIGN